jgi:hypothetical protein
MMIELTFLCLFALMFPATQAQITERDSGTALHVSEASRIDGGSGQDPKAWKFDVFTPEEVNKVFSRRPSPSRTDGDSSGGCKDCEVKARLDNFAIQLQNDPAATAYLIPTTSRRSGPLSEEQEKAITTDADRLKDYLVNRGIDAARCTIVIGFEYKTRTVQLWIVPAGAAAPIP